MMARASDRWPVDWQAERRRVASVAERAEVAVIARPAEIIAERWPMVGGGTAYDMRVPLRLSHGAVIIAIHDGEKYTTVCDATLPAEHWSSPQGWDRYQAYTAHEKAARRAQLDWAREVFAELADAPRWPTLWVPGRTLERQTWRWTEASGWERVR